MKSKNTKRNFTKAAVGAAIGGIIAGPVGAVAGGLAATQTRTAKKKPAARRKSSNADDPLLHAKLQRILVPLDFSQPSQRAVRFARDWAKRFGAQVCLLHVIEPTLTVTEFGMVPARPGQPDLADLAKTALEKLAKKEFPAGMSVRVEIRRGVPYDEIAIAAGKWKADLIIIATHGRTGLSHVLLGSTAERVVRHAPCPVLTLRRRPGR